MSCSRTQGRDASEAQPAAAAPGSPVKHSTTEPLCSPLNDCEPVYNKSKNKQVCQVTWAYSNIGYIAQEMSIFTLFMKKH